MRITCQASYQCDYLGRPHEYKHFPDRPVAFNAFIDFNNEAEGDAFLSRFPKSMNIRGLQASLRTTFYPTKMNEGRNEKGVKRVRRFLSECGPVEWQCDVINGYRHTDDFLAAIGDS